MDELTRAVRLSMVDQEIYDDTIVYNTRNNISCYIDSPTEAKYERIVQRTLSDGTEEYLFGDEARQLDEVPWYAAGNMTGLTLTFSPHKGSNGSIFDLKEGVTNQFVQIKNNQRFGAMPKLYSRVKSITGEKIEIKSQTYRNSEYTVFISLGKMTGNDETQLVAFDVYGQWSGTNLPAEVSYKIVTDRTKGETTETDLEINDAQWNEENGNKLTINPGDLNGGGSYTKETQTGNSVEYEDEDVENEITPDEELEEPIENPFKDNYEIVVENDLRLNMIIKLFDFDKGINDESKMIASPNGEKYYFYSPNNNVDYYTEPYEFIDSKKHLVNANQSNAKFAVDWKLNANGYPVIKSKDLKKTYGSLEYIFDGSAKREDGTSALVATLDDTGGLFRTNNGLYEYDSAKTAAYYFDERPNDSKPGKFYLIDYAVRPKHVANTSSTSKTELGNFLPFNDPTKIQTNTAKDIGATNSYALEDPMNAWFGMYMEFDFKMPENGIVNEEDMIFEFLGDDDVLVFVDDVLLIDISGCHLAQSGTINFATGEIIDPRSPNGTTIKERFSLAGVTEGLNGNTLADNTIHKLKFFYLDRGAYYAYNRIKFNIPLKETIIIQNPTQRDR